ncbi:MAG: DUF2244 domain-containing protein [Hyphomicrobium sp.]|jgi:uncharacterized membrane protein
MSQNPDPKQAPIAPATRASDDGTERSGTFRVVLYPHRSLGPTGFLMLMIAIGGVSFITGMVFLMKGAWPVFGFFGLDVALVYAAFRLNYRAGRLYETVDLTPENLTITRVHPSGAQESFDFNPYWVRVRLAEGPQGRTDLRLASHGREFAFARFLTDDERRELVHVLSGALAQARAAQA